MSHQIWWSCFIQTDFWICASQLAAFVICTPSCCGCWIVCEKRAVVLLWTRRISRKTISICHVQLCGSLWSMCLQNQGLWVYCMQLTHSLTWFICLEFSALISPAIHFPPLLSSSVCPRPLFVIFLSATLLHLMPRSPLLQFVLLSCPLFRLTPLPSTPALISLCPFQLSTLFHPPAHI